MKAIVRTLLVVMISLALGAMIFAAGSAVSLVSGGEERARSERLTDEAESRAEDEVDGSEMNESRVEGLDSIAFDLGLIALVTVGILGVELVVRRKPAQK
ncbi:MAG: hypothetical protein Q8S43_00935 [Actinomycetota bacterium]|nr:MAG: hypothetical protein FD171_110 [Actinomycetota bacterium]MDO8950638.1 hypothetical protein [Actinomycetota bacterium]MDP3629504.1 hypothetical protein [Actinomycetota bacterium]MDZ4234856.1 hypothetical protein [Dietzia sp.]